MTHPEMIKAILFDMDGVLIDAREWHYLALNQALEKHGYTISLAEHEEIYDGLPTQKKLDMLTKHCGLNPDKHLEINKDKQRHTMDIAMKHLSPNLIHQELLRSLKQDGYKMAVCSNSIRSTIKSFLTQADIINYFDFYLSNEDVVSPKPDPEIYAKACMLMGLKPQECLVIEDNEKGISAAKGAGCPVLKVESPQEVYRDKLYSFLSLLNA
jgi:beta-phosphoglucomutase